jgi:hypothetical protein
MELEGDGVLKGENGSIISEVSYSIAPVRSGQGGDAAQRDKTGLEAIRLVPKRELLGSEIPAYAILETSEGRLYRLVITTTFVTPVHFLEATGTEIEDSD